jgi:hypothetical protein
MQVQTCNPSTEEMRQEDCKFKANLGYLERPYLKKRKKKKCVSQ